MLGTNLLTFYKPCIPTVILQHSVPSGRHNVLQLQAHSDMGPTLHLAR